MTFNTEVKNEILELWQKKQCCKLAECLGLLLFATDYSENKIGLKTENELIANHFKKLIKKCLSKECEQTISTKNIIRVYVKNEDITMVRNNFNLDIADKIFSCDNCKSAFLRGAFISGGKISNPNNEYRAEFITKSEDISCFLYGILFNLNLVPKMTIKSKKVSVYLKDSESIEDLLTLMGATKSSLKMMNTKILKDIRNNTNRRTNFETANIKKAALSSAKHISAIEKLEKANILDTLPDDLKQIAIARKENLGMSLSELGKMFSMSRSGIYHRLKKICEISENL